MGNLSSRATDPTTTLLVAAHLRDVVLCLTLSTISRGCHVVLAAGDAISQYRAALRAGNAPVRRGLTAQTTERALGFLLERYGHGLVRVRPHSRAELLAELSTNLCALLPPGQTAAGALDSAAFVARTLLAESEALSHYPDTQLLVFASAAPSKVNQYRLMREVLRDCFVRYQPVAKVVVPNCGGALVDPAASEMCAVRCALETIYRECQGRGAPVPAFSLHYQLFGFGCDAHAPPVTAALDLLNFHDHHPQSRGRFDDNLPVAERFYQRFGAAGAVPGPALAGWAAAYELLCKGPVENSWWWVYFNVYISGQPEYARLLLASANGQGEDAVEEFDHDFLGMSNQERAVMARKLLASCYVIDFL